MKPLPAAPSLTLGLTLALAGAGPARAQCPLEQWPLAGALPGDGTGLALALSGDLAVIGAPYAGDPVPQAGVVYVVERLAGTWTQTARLLSPTPGVADRFGSAVAVAGDTILVGEPFDDSSAPEAGAVHVFAKGGGGWSDVQLLTAPGAVTGELFGHALAAAGDHLLVGAPTLTAAPGALPGPGTAYVFEHAAGAWQPSGELVAADGFDGQQFGFSVALHGDTALVGAPGYNVHVGQPGGYVFERAGGLWFPTAKLLGGGTSQQFGFAVALHGDRALVGSPADNQAGGNGVAWVFERQGFDWGPGQLLTALKGGSLHRFGASVALAGDVALVGEPGNGLQGYMNGAAHLFHPAGDAWTQTLLLAHDTTAQLEFGAAVALDGGQALVTAPTGDPGQGGSTAYLWSAEPAPPLQAAPLALPVGAGGDQDFTLQACPGQAGATYLVFGSLALVGPSSPGLVYGGYLLPLEVDAYTLHTLANPNAPPLSGAQGVLDGAAQATARFTLPAGSNPAWIGTTLHHAFAVIEPAGLAVVLVSNAMPVELVP